MQIAVYSDGRKLDFDEATSQFKIGDAPVTPQQVAGYDAAGQLAWTSPQSRSWFQQYYGPAPTAAAAGVPAQPAKKRRTGLIIGIVVGVVVLCGICGVVGSLGHGGSSSTTATTSSDGTASKPGASRQAAPAGTPSTGDQTAKIGQPLTVGDLTFTVSDAKATQKLTNPLGSKSGNWILVDGAVKNGTKQAVIIDSSYFKLIAKDGSEYETDSDNIMYLDSSKNFFLEKINPNLSKEGQLLFAVPAGAKPADFKLHVQTNLFGGDTGEISLSR